MVTLEQLQERKRELEAKLEAGDLSVEPALQRLDRAIMSRSLQVQHSRLRLTAAKQAVASGMDKDKARRMDTRVAAKTTAKKIAEARAKKILNRF